MEGVITVNEDRETLEKLKAIKEKKLRELESNNFKEQMIDKGVDIAKGIVKVTGATLTVVMAICPFDGPFGEVATMLATPALVSAIESSRDLLKATFVEKDTDKISGALTDLAGNIQSIKITDNDVVQNVQTVEIPLEEREVSNELGR